LGVDNDACNCNQSRACDELMDVRPSEPEFRALMTSGLDGDAAAHRALLERLSDQLRAYFKGQLNRIGRGPVEAEDLVQECLIAIHTRRHTYDRSQLFTPWVYGIARYKFLDYLRRTRVSAADVPIEEAQELVVDDDSAHVESSLDLKGLMAELSPKARQVLQYVKLDGLSVSEAAARSGMSESAVKVSVHRGLKTLARLISEQKRS
jgi:RNA polymerase sigma-70 factor (ECF subfamily)